MCIICEELDLFVTFHLGLHCGLHLVTTDLFCIYCMRQILGKLQPFKLIEDTSNFTRHLPSGQSRSLISPQVKGARTLPVLRSVTMETPTFWPIT